MKAIRGGRTLWISGWVSGMRLRNSVAALLITPLAYAGTFFVSTAPASSWSVILFAAGHFPGQADTPDIFDPPPGTPQPPEWKARLDRGAAIILEGSSPLAGSLGFRAEAEILSIVHPVDVHNPRLPIVWSQPL